MLLVPSAPIPQDHLGTLTYAQRNPAQPIKALTLAASASSVAERTTQRAQQVSALEQLREESE